ncbi:MAG TPA: S9 family peptidase, partial [Thermoanaerobaculia bacterium]|nr:S9 family peptidase [Thermoanaerobaculia bacterium]
MKKLSLWFLALLFAGLAAFVQAAEPPRALTPDDIYAIKSVGDPHLSPDGRYVAFTVRAFQRKEDNSDTDIYMVPTAGGEALRLTGSPKAETTPRFSPDGRYLAFLSGREGKKSQVWLLPRVGGEAFQLTQFKSDVQELAWSPDGKRLALVVGDIDPDDPDTADDSPAATAAKDKEKKDEPAKAPKPIVIRRRQFKRDTEGYLREVRNHLYVFDVATKASEQITSGPYDETSPVWSPDGQQIAFVSNRTADPDANQNTDIFVVAAKAGAAPRDVSAAMQGSDEGPTWSPDGKQIAFVAGGDPKDMWYGPSAIAVVAVGAVDSGAPRLLTRELDRNVREPRFTPDGKAILFLVEEGGNSHLARVPVAAGGKVERVVEGEREIESFDVDAKGNIVLLASEPDLPAEIFAVKPGGAALDRLSHVNDAFLSGIRLGSVVRYKAK